MLYIDKIDEKDILKFKLSINSKFQYYINNDCIWVLLDENSYDFKVNFVDSVSGVREQISLHDTYNKIMTGRFYLINVGISRNGKSVGTYLCITDLDKFPNLLDVFMRSSRDSISVWANPQIKGYYIGKNDLYYSNLFYNTDCVVNCFYTDMTVMGLSKDGEKIVYYDVESSELICYDKSVRIKSKKINRNVPDKFISDINDFLREYLR